MLLNPRRHPARGVLIDESIPTVVDTTICTQNRKRWLANPKVHAAVRAAWLRHTSWMVTAYVLMPDHVHFFAEPGERWLPFDDWLSVWKRGMARLLRNREWRWRAGSFHHRLRCYEDLVNKRTYMDKNPVRAGLVRRVKD
ncbi:MAG: hypothetical protein JO271_17955 [Verrucomicrobia bacterium]|nr:hypothetical protein [Verrucomicrobiota bacterium]